MRWLFVFSLLSLLAGVALYFEVERQLRAWRLP